MGTFDLKTIIEEEKDTVPKFIPQLQWPRQTVTTGKSQRKQGIVTTWQFSNILYHYYKPSPEIINALEAFMEVKSAKIAELINNNITITYQNISLGGDDRGKLKNNAGTRNFDHYHLKVRDSQKGNIVVVYREFINNQIPQNVTINLITIVNHSHYDNAAGLAALAKLAANATYTPMILKETTWPLFAWLKRIIQ